MANSTEYEFNDYTQRVLVATVILGISTLGIIGNSLVVLAVLLTKKLRTVVNVFVVNLSIADVLTCLVIPWHSVALLNIKKDLPLLNSICGVVAVVVYTTVGCSIYTLASVGLNRLMLITRPTTTYRKIFTPKKIAVWLVFIWLVPFIFVTLPLLFKLGAVMYSKQLHFCGPDRAHPNAHSYDLILAGTLYPIPSIIITISYILIWRHLRRHARRMASTPEETDHSSYNDRTVASNSLATMTNNSPVSQPRISRRQTEITKNMFYIVCAFVVCLTPYAISLFINDSDAAKPYTAAGVLLNSCLNPFIYATKHRDFKTVFGCIFHRKWDDIPEPSECLKAMRRVHCKRRSTRMT